MRRPITAWVAVSLLSGTLSGAAPAPRVTLTATEATAVEQAFFNDLNDGRLDRFDLGDAFLIASGITSPAVFGIYQKRLAALRRQAVAAVPAGGARERGAALLVWLHAHVLKRYRREATTADQVMDRGEFNCLSSAVLYAIVAADAGLSVEGILVPDHALCSVRTPRGMVDVEAGISQGFDPNAQARDHLTRITGEVYAAEPRDRKIVPLLPFIGEIYANRAAFMAPDKRGEAMLLSLYKKAWRYDPSSDLFTRNIISCLNNLAVAAIGKKQYDAAADYIAQGEQFAPGDPVFRDIEENMINDRVLQDIATGRYQDAVTRANAGLGRYPASASLRQNMVHAYDVWARVYTSRGRYDEGIRVLRAARAAVPEDTTIPYNLSVALYNKAVECYNTKRFTDALAVCDQGLALFPDDARFRQLRQAAAEERDARQLPKGDNT